MLNYDRRHWHRHLFTIKGSVLPYIFPRVIFFGLISAGETWLVLFEHWKPFPLAPFTVLGIALGLLLTLRTNASYDRFWEGRKAWGMIVNRSRNIARQWGALFKDPSEREFLAESIIGFCEAGKRQLRGLAPKKGATRYLNDLSQHFLECRREGKLDSLDLQRLETDLTCLVDQLGCSERIQRTPIPIAYVLHTRRFLVAYCLCLPLALAEDFGWGTPFVLAFVAYSFLGIERIGVEIEDPFETSPNDIDLDAITKTISTDVRDLLDLN
jgi:ion channel-forming bestrophin family protein